MKSTEVLRQQEREHLVVLQDHFQAERHRSPYPDYSMTNDVSPIFSIKDIEITSRMNTFERKSMQRMTIHHIAVFPPSRSMSLRIDHKNSIILKSILHDVQLREQRGTVYMVQFVRGPNDQVMIIDNRMIIRCNQREKYDFEVPTLSNEKTKLLFKSSSDPLANVEC